MMNEEKWNDLCESLASTYAKVSEVVHLSAELENRRAKLLDRAVSKKDSVASKEYWELETEALQLEKQLSGLIEKRQRLDQQVSAEATRRFEVRMNGVVA